jgi:hypothetical protein
MSRKKKYFFVDVSTLIFVRVEYIETTVQIMVNEDFDYKICPYIIFIINLYIT